MQDIYDFEHFQSVVSWNTLFSGSQKSIFFALIIKALSLGIFTSLGFVVLFGSMGLLLGLFGSLIRAWIPLLGLIIGILLIIIGIFFLGFPTFSWRLQRKG